MYIHEAGNWPSQTVDVHHLVIRRNRRRTIVACFLAIVLLLYAFYLLLGQVCWCIRATSPFISMIITLLCIFKVMLA